MARLGRRRFLGLALLAACLHGRAGADPRQDSGEWPGWGGPGGDFRIAPSPLSPAPPGPDASHAGLAWTRSLGGGYGGLAVDATGLYCLLRRGEQETALALDPATGKPLWQRSEPVPLPELDYGPGPFATAQIAGPLVVFQSGGGALRAYEKAGGKLRWRRDLHAELSGSRPLRGYGASPLLLDGALILTTGAPGASVLALRAIDGELLWKRHSFGCDYATPIAVEVDGKAQIVAHMEEEVVGLDPRSGDLLWSRPSRADRTRHVIAPLDLGGGRILVSTTHGNECLDLGKQEPELLWTSRRICAQVGNLLHVPPDGDRGGFVLGASSALAGALLVALDDSTGRVLWRQRGVDCGYLWSSGKELFSWSTSGELTRFRASREGLDLRSRMQVLDEDKAWSAPAMTQARLYLKGQERILALER